MDIPLNERIDHHRATLEMLLALSNPKSYTNEALIVHLGSQITHGGRIFAESDLAKLECHGIVYHHQLVEWDVGAFIALFGEPSWLNILTRYVEKYRLMVGMKFIEEDRRLFRGVPDNYFNSAYGPTLRSTLLQIQGLHRKVGYELTRETLRHLARHGIVYVADYVFGDLDTIQSLLRGVSSHPEASAATLAKFVRNNGGPRHLRPTLAERIELAKMPRP